MFYSKIMFVLQIGSISQTDSCNTNLSDPNTVDKAVLLQYSVNNGITWQVIAQHQPKDFIQAQRVSYNVPLWVPSHISLLLSAQDIFLLRKNLSLHHCARKNVDERVNKEENLRGRLIKKFQPSVLSILSIYLKEKQNTCFKDGGRGRRNSSLSVCIFHH